MHQSIRFLDLYLHIMLENNDIKGIHIAIYSFIIEILQQ